MEDRVRRQVPHFHRRAAIQVSRDITVVCCDMSSARGRVGGACRSTLGISTEPPRSDRLRSHYGDEKESRVMFMGHGNSVEKTPSLSSPSFPPNVTGIVTVKINPVLKSL